jgi:hypothetical protein
MRGKTGFFLVKFLLFNNCTLTGNCIAALLPAVRSPLESRFQVPGSLIASIDRAPPAKPLSAKSLS